MNYEFYDDASILNGYMPYMNNLALFSPYEGFLKGNAMKDEYIPYKNYKVRTIEFKSEKEELLFNILEYSFMMHDLNLYLDINPNDEIALNEFNEYRKKSNELTKKYERKYGPLEVCESDSNKTFNWVSMWPWVN